MLDSSKFSNLFFYKKIIIVLMRNGFGFNTNLIETNVLNLRVVLSLVVSQVGEVLKNRLDDRRKIILSILQEADKKKEQLRQQLEEARKAIKEAQLMAKDIRDQSLQAVEKENYTAEQKLKEDLKRFQENSQQIIKLERQRTLQVVTQYIADLALKEAEDRLLKTLESRGQVSTKQKELNEIHVQETFRKLKRRSNLILLFNIYNFFFLSW
jgi:F-type H+-transporting ATPase subunit b